MSFQDHFIFLRMMMQNDATLTEKQRKTSRTTSNHDSTGALQF